MSYIVAHFYGRDVLHAPYAPDAVREAVLGLIGDAHACPDGTGKGGWIYDYRALAGTGTRKPSIVGRWWKSEKPPFKLRWKKIDDGGEAKGPDGQVYRIKRYERLVYKPRVLLPSRALRYGVEIEFADGRIEALPSEHDIDFAGRSLAAISGPKEACLRHAQSLHFGHPRYLEDPHKQGEG